jgi:hypothetical protein
MKSPPLVLLLAAGLFPVARAQFIQQGNKLVGTGSVGSAQEGVSAALSGNGNTAIIGGNTDNNSTGAVWIFTRLGAAWSQQGNKLVGTGAVGSARQGISVAISADGNTAIAGGRLDNGGVGAAWVYTQTNGAWSQQGNKLGASDAVGAAYQSTVALSADGNTAIVGGIGDSNFVGAAWVYTRANGVWSQQGSKLVGTGYAGTANQGFSVALSGDGNTAIVGGEVDNSGVGAAWVYTRANGVWSQQGSKLLGAGSSGVSNQGFSVALSADGNTAVVGAANDNNSVGAVWVYTRANGVWAQQGNKLVGTGSVGVQYQGSSVALSADGNTVLIGAYGDNSTVGAAWIFTRTGGAWAQQGNKLVGAGAAGTAEQGFSVALSADATTALVGGPTDNNSLGAAWVYALPHPAFFRGEVALSGGVYYLQFPGNNNVFGYYNYQVFPWLYHYDLGFEYFIDAQNGSGGAYLYDSASGHFFYTSPSFPFPYLYDFSLMALLYYYPDTSLAGHYTTSPRYFYNFSTGKIITM